MNLAEESREEEMFQPWHGWGQTVGVVTIMCVALAEKGDRLWV